MNQTTLISVAICLTAIFAFPALGNDANAMKNAVSELAGQWHGVLEYRDYRSDKRVEIPHHRTVQAAPDDSYLLMTLSFTDPGFKVFAVEAVTFDQSHLTTAYIENGTVTTSSLEVTRFANQEGGWIAELIGQGEDNNQPATIKFVWQQTDNSLSVEKLVRTDPQGPFEFRNIIRLERDSPKAP